VSAFFSDFLPSATPLQRAQGCLPSKVRWRAAEKEVVARLSTNIVVQANDWRKAQCRPIEQANASAIRSLGNLWNTRRPYGLPAPRQISFRTSDSRRISLAPLQAAQFLVCCAVEDDGVLAADLHARLADGRPVGRGEQDSGLKLVIGE